MTNEEMQRTMDFIVEMEAKSSAKIDALTQAQKEGQAEADQRWKRADERWARTEEGIRALLAITEMPNARSNPTLSRFSVSARTPRLQTSVSTPSSTSSNAK